VGVEAEVRQHRWEQEGKKRVANQLVIIDVHLLSSAQKRTESSAEVSEETNLAYREEFDLPEEERYQEDIF
jgi:single-stranded DNA-binding protein